MLEHLVEALKIEHQAKPSLIFLALRPGVSAYKSNVT